MVLRRDERQVRSEKERVWKIDRKKEGRKLKDKKEGSIVSNYNCIKWNREYKRSDTMLLDFIR